MNTVLAAHAATETTICPHLLTGLQRPFALLSTTVDSVYLCPACFADRVETRLKNGKSATAIFRSASFIDCGHDIDHNVARPICWPCLTAITAELTSRWAHHFYLDKPHANRLLRLIHKLSKCCGRHHGTSNFAVMFGGAQ
jgi:hypothetical protein